MFSTFFLNVLWTQTLKHDLQSNEASVFTVSCAETKNQPYPFS